MSDAPSKIIPNTFQTPNALTDDEIMAVLTGNETKCYLVVVRKTFGWHKQADRIAKSQIMAMTGLGETAVDACMDTLVDFGLVLRLAENDPNSNAGVLWGLQTDDNGIHWDKLRERVEARNQRQSERMAKVRSKRGGGVDGQPQVDEQPQGGVDGQAPQKPLSKTKSLVVVNADIAKISKAYEQEFGALTPMIVDAIKDTLDTYPPEWIPEAMQIAVRNNKRNWKYVEGILKRCKEKNVRPSLNRLEQSNGNTKPNSSSAAKGKPSGRSNGQSNAGTGSAGREGQDPGAGADPGAAERHHQRWQQLRKQAKVPAVQ